MKYIERERVLLAPYAMHAADTVGSHCARSPITPTGRPTNATATGSRTPRRSRRLSHKTQVFTRDLRPRGETRATTTARG